MRVRGRRKTHVFFGNALPKSNAHAHLKQRKKHSGLRDAGENVGHIITPKRHIYTPEVCVCANLEVSEIHVCSKNNFVIVIAIFGSEM